MSAGAIFIRHDLIQLRGALGEIRIVHKVDKSLTRLYRAVLAWDQVGEDLDPWCVEKGKSLAEGFVGGWTDLVLWDGTAEGAVARISPFHVRLEVGSDGGAGTVGADEEVSMDAAGFPGTGFPFHKHPVCIWLEA